MARNICTECTLDDVKRLLDRIEKSPESATQFLTRPRSFLADNGWFMPLGGEIVMTPTEEQRARMYSPEGRQRFSANLTGAKIKIHVKDGLAKCVKVEFE